jgi:hypothetical protein
MEHEDLPMNATATQPVESRLMLHCGAREVDRDALRAVPCPPPTETWFPIGHAAVIDAVTESLGSAGFQVARARYALSRGDARMFATLDLAVDLAAGVTVAVGVRNSTDQSFPLGFAAGSRVFVCDNLSFSAELMIKHKHTRFGFDHYRDELAGSVDKLAGYREAEGLRIARMQDAGLTDVEAESLLMRAYERRLLGPATVLPALREWREPSFDEFKPRNVWSLLNAITHVLGDQAKKHPDEHARRTRQIQSMLCPPSN